MYLFHTLISAMDPMKGFLSKKYLPTIRNNSVSGPALVMIPLSNFPVSKILSLRT